MTERALVFAGGDALSSTLAAELPARALVIGADSGIDHAQTLGRRVDVAIGDFDSVTPQGLARAEHDGARIERHPPDKDATDLELALEAALAAGARRVTVVGGHGGRLDHLLGNLALLAAPRLAALTVDAWFGGAYVVVIRDRTDVHGAPGSLVSLLAMHGPATGVRTDGLRFPLRDAVLEPGSTLGISNELLGSEATVTVTGGVLLAIQPARLPPPPTPSPRGGT